MTAKQEPAHHWEALAFSRHSFIHYISSSDMQPFILSIFFTQPSSISIFLESISGGHISINFFMHSIFLAIIYSHIFLISALVSVIIFLQVILTHIPPIMAHLAHIMHMQHFIFLTHSSVIPHFSFPSLIHIFMNSKTSNMHFGGHPIISILTAHILILSAQ